MCCISDYTVFSRIYCQAFRLSYSSLLNIQKAIFLFSTKDGFFDKLVRRGGSHGASVIYFAYFEVAKVDNPDNDLDL